ncbi:MAG: alpha/beta fold hydrolase [Geothrix sp.]|nr:alpha/beta fold hydrolase [Geothrix sp.]
MKIPSTPLKLRVHGHQLAYHRMGKGPPVLLVHGITTYSFIWKGVLPGLAEDHEVVAVDLLGCGDSDKPLDASYGIAEQVELLESFTQALGFGPFSLVGHDIGGGIAQRFAVQHPDRLTHAAVINGVAYDFWPVQPIIAMRTPIIRQLAMATLDLGAFSLIVRRGVFHKERVTPELMALFRRPLETRHGRKAFLHFAESLDNRDLTTISGELRQTKVPFLIVRGANDVYLSTEISEKLHREIPGSRLDEVPHAGHFIQVDQPERLVELLRAFLRT